jgi:hypothetical protein
MAASVTRRPLAAEACVTSKASLCGIYVGFVVGKTALQEVSLLVLLFRLTANDPYIFTHLSPTLYNHGNRRCL